MEGIVLICNMDLYCAIAIFSGTGDTPRGDIFTHRSPIEVTKAALDD